jgi:hypothetical protein
VLDDATQLQCNVQLQTGIPPGCPTVPMTVPSHWRYWTLTCAKRIALQLQGMAGNKEVKSQARAVGNDKAQVDGVH